MSLEDEIDEIARAAAGATSKTPEPVNPADDPPEIAAILSQTNAGYSAARRQAQDDRREQAKRDAPLSQAAIDEARLLRDLQIRITPEEKAAIEQEDAQLDAAERTRSATLDEPTNDRRAGADAVARERAAEWNEEHYAEIAAGTLPFHEGPAPVAILADHGADR